MSAGKTKKVAKKKKKAPAVKSPNAHLIKRSKFVSTGRRVSLRYDGKEIYTLPNDMRPEHFSIDKTSSVFGSGIMSNVMLYNMREYYRTRIWHNGDIRNVGELVDAVMLRLKIVVYYYMNVTSMPHGRLSGSGTMFGIRYNEDLDADGTSERPNDDEGYFAYRALSKTIAYASQSAHNLKVFVSLREVQRMRSLSGDLQVKASIDMFTRELRRLEEIKAWLIKNGRDKEMGVRILEG